MVYNLPTISSLNRQNNLSVRRREISRYEVETECTHTQLRRFAGGRCPMCYRISMRNYSRNVRARRRRRPRPQAAAPISLSSFLGKLEIPLPGRRVYGRADDICSVCMNSYASDRLCQELPCGHRFHVWCYQKWHVRKHNCPMCRAEF